MQLNHNKYCELFCTTCQQTCFKNGTLHSWAQRLNQGRRHNLHSLWNLSSKCSLKKYNTDLEIPCYNVCGIKRSNNIFLTLDSSLWKSHVVMVCLPIHLSLASAQQTFYPLDLPGQSAKSMQQFNKWHKKKDTLHILTCGVMRECGLSSLVVCNNGKNVM